MLGLISFNVLFLDRLKLIGYKRKIHCICGYPSVLLHDIWDVKNIFHKFISGNVTFGS